jgi:hypothetical protein
MVEISWADGTILTATIGAIGRPATRTLSARLDLTDDRSYLSDAHRDLVDMLPNLSIHPGQPASHGWIRVGVGAAACEIHVVLQTAPPAAELVLGLCAVELLTAATGDAADPDE